MDEKWAQTTTIGSSSTYLDDTQLTADSLFFFNGYPRTMCLKIISFYFGQNFQKTIPFGISWQSVAVQKVRVSAGASKGPK